MRPRPPDPGETREQPGPPEQPGGSRPPVRADPRTWPAETLLFLLFLGYPLWWLLGVSEFLPLLVAVPMALSLARSRPLRVPPGFTAWMLFLVWVAAGIFVLWTAAPGAQPGGGMSRLMVYGYRLAWYLALTTALLWACNTSRRRLPLARLATCLAVMFVYTTVGGLLGTFLGAIEMRSALELVLPDGITQNNFVKSLIHPGLADVMDVLGDPEPRPKAPFAYANSWGANYSLFLPFVFVAWLRASRSRRTQGLAALLLLASAVPVVYSLNRGLWASLAVAAAGAALLAVRRMRPAAIIAAGAATVVCGLVLVTLTPLGTVIGERFANPHSNSRRADLAWLTVSSVLRGSPVLGFGTTRDVQGSFGSIAGGATPECPACEVPPLGTQGHLWLVLFSQGAVGLVLFLGLFVCAALAFWRCRTQLESLSMLVLVFLVLQIWVYDVLGLPLFVTMLVLGLGWRERFESQAGSATFVPTLGRILSLCRGAAPALTACIAAGALLGGVMTLAQPRLVEGRVDLLVPPDPVTLEADNLLPDGKMQATTLDTEAQRLVSDPVLAGVVGSRNRDRIVSLRHRVQVTAVPTSDVLSVTVHARGDGTSPTVTAREIAGTFLAMRRTELVNRYRTSIRQYRTAMASTTADLRAQDSLITRERGPIRNTQFLLAEELGRLATVSLDPGRVLRTRSPEPVPRTPEVLVPTGALLGLLVGTGLIGLQLVPPAGVATRHRRTVGRHRRVVRAHSWYRRRS